MKTNFLVKIASDSTNVYPSNAQGRPSIRLHSKQVYNGGLFIFDVDHMPTGPGTWPAWWTTNVDDWPYKGEIDIIEAIGGMVFNQISMHTGDGCFMQDHDYVYFTGRWTKDRNKNATNCYFHAAGEDYNFGCSIQAQNGTFGTPWNAIGGVVVMEWDPTQFVRVFQFYRDQIPDDITNGFPTPSSWGKPIAQFNLGANCTANHFIDHKIILNTDFCGDWAGQFYPGGYAACDAFVKENPSQYKDAYWLVNSLKVYTY